MMNRQDVWLVGSFVALGACLLSAGCGSSSVSAPLDAGAGGFSDASDPSSCKTGSCEMPSCNDGKVAVGNVCRTPCTALDCDEQGRVCIEATAAGDATCAGCKAGQESEDGTCGTSCADLGCEALHRTCVDAPTPACAEACVAGFVWDASAGACREPKTCADIACADAQHCVPEDASSDAHCEGAACPPGQGWDPSSARCFGCANDFSPTCDAEGETGNVLITSGAAGGVCQCETEDDFYISSESSKAVPCDSDRDGWVNDNAQAVLESDNPVERENARCHVRRVRAVVVENEQGEVYTAASYEASFAEERLGVPAGLPLYESAQTDGAPGSAGQLAVYPGSGLTPSDLNAFTKACARGDFNGNALSDSGESAESTLDDQQFTGRLRGYYAEYVKLSYFLELHDGYYDEARGASYRIVERKRQGAPAERLVPLRYPARDGLDSPSSTTCGRHIDGTYRWSAGAPGSVPVLTSANTIGADFARLGDVNWRGMTHHSQFKCVEVVSESQYEQYSNGGAADNDEFPQVVVATNGELRRKDKNGVLDRRTWFANDCVSEQGASPAPGAGLRGTLPKVTCTALNEPPRPDTVIWAAVGFENGGQTQRYQSYLTPGDYKSGCVNQCVEAPDGTPALSGCQSCRAVGFGERSISQGAPNTGAPCGQCGGTVKCDGSCSVATPPNLGQGCGACGSTIQCDGSCNNLAPGNLGGSCGACGGTINCGGQCSYSDPWFYDQACGTCQRGKYDCSGTCRGDWPANANEPCGSCGGHYDCNGNCTRATPTDLGNVIAHTDQQESFTCCWVDYTKTFGGACAEGYEYAGAYVEKISGGGSCYIVSEGDPYSCSVRVRFHNNGVEGAKCRVIINQRRVCDR